VGDGKIERQSGGKRTKDTHPVTPWHPSAGGELFEKIRHGEKRSGVAISFNSVILSPSCPRRKKE